MIRVSLQAIILGGILFPGLSALPQEDKSPLPNGYREVGSDTVGALHQLCQATAETGLFSGAVLVAEKGKVIYKAAFGLANSEWDIPNTTDTKFRLASVSKQFCSMLVMQLVQEGKLSLEDKITKHLPYYRKDTGEKITIHHLLSHQSGIKDYTASFDYRSTISRLPFDPDEFIKLHCSGDLLHEPGTFYAYCNAGYSILGRIVEKVTFKTFEQNLQERIFGPVGMVHSGYDRHRYVLPKRASGYTRGSFGYENADYMDMDSSPGAAGAIYSTVEDMFLWDRALHSNQLLDEKHRNLMFTPNRDVPEIKAAGGRPQSIYGYGWQIYTRTHPVTKKKVKVINHGGAIHGFRAMENRLPDEDCFVIVLCNQGDAFGASDVWNTVVQLSTELIHVVTGQPYQLPGKPRMTQDQRLYQIVKDDGVEAAIQWFKAHGKRAAWGGSNMALAEQLLRDGRIDEGLRFMEFEIEISPGKVWVLKKAAQALMSHGQFKKALVLLDQALSLKPDDESLQMMKAEVERAAQP